MKQAIVERKQQIVDVAIYLVFVITILLVSMQKVNMHMDEILTYGLSNYEGEGIELPIIAGETYYPPQTIWGEYMAVGEENRFRYDIVWQNQGEDVHPPMHYAILHTICSFFPGYYSVWFGILINVVFACGVLFFIRKLIFLLSDSKWIELLASVAFIFSANILSLTSFVRMYILAMFWIVALTYVMISRIGHNLRALDYIMILFCTMCAALTHYYCIVYIVVFSIFYGIYLLFEKRWKEVFIFCIVQIAAALMAIAIFPSMLKHIFSGYRGVESFERMGKKGLAASLSETWKFWNLIDRELFGGLLTYILVVAIISFFVCRYYNMHGKKYAVDKIALTRFVCCVGTCALYFLVISRVAVSADTRYTSPMYGVLFTVVVCGAGMWCRRITKIQYTQAIFLLILTIMTVNGWKNQEWEYLYRYTQPLMETTEQYEDIDCICIYDSKARVATAYKEAANLHSITFYRNGDLDMFKSSDISTHYELIVITDMTVDDQEVLDEIIDICPNIDAYEYLGEGVCTATYYVYSTDSVMG